MIFFFQLNEHLSYLPSAGKLILSLCNGCVSVYRESYRLMPWLHYPRQRENDWCCQLPKRQKMFSFSIFICKRMVNIKFSAVGWFDCLPVCLYPSHNRLLIHPSVRWSINPIYSPPTPSIHPRTTLSPIHPYLYPSHLPSIRPIIHLDFHPLFGPFTYPSVHPSVRASIKKLSSTFPPKDNMSCHSHV